MQFLIMFSLRNPFAGVFDLPPTASQFKTIRKSVKRNSLDLDTVFTKFKVNKFSLNFFLKNLQFDPDYKNARSRTIKNPDGSFLDIYVTAKKRK
jgi:hypothetical protein